RGFVYFPYTSLFRSQLEKRERVLDFLPLVEADAANDLVGDSLAHQRVFDRARLRVGAVQHRHQRTDVLLPARLDRTHDEVRFLRSEEHTSELQSREN